MSGIICAGYAGADILTTIDSFPERHGLSTVKNISLALGGAVCNCALDLARLSPSDTIKPMAIIGDDTYGKAIMEEFAKYHNMDTSLVIRGGATGFTTVLDEETTRVRTFLVYRGANMTFNADMIDPSKLDADIFHIGYICLLDALDAPDSEYGTGMARVLKKVRDAGIMTSVDAVTDSTGRHKYLMPAAMKYTDIMCVNEHEGGAAFDTDLRENDTLDIEKTFAVLREFKKSGVKKWAIIHAPECACGIDENGKEIYIPGALLPEGFIKGTVGAGDAFVSGVLLGAKNKMKLEDAINDGLAAAVMSLTAAGASEGVGTIEEARKLFNSIPRRETAR